VTPEQLAPHVAAALPRLQLRQPWQRLGGSVNCVWRAAGEPHGAIVKYAPPHVAAAPELALGAQRSGLEAAALRLVGGGGALADCLGSRLRAPRVLAALAEPALLVLEDFGPCPDLAAALCAQPARAAELGELGAALGRLHARSARNPELARGLDNADVQRARRRIQYAAIGPLLAAAALADAGALGARAAALGDALLEPGRCLVMGDLWPAALLALPQGRGWAWIDWEFAHWGRPLQDAAHLAAHLWMRAELAAAPRTAAALREGLRAFLEAYAEQVHGAALWDERELAQAHVHAGCEILVRSHGPFRAGEPYAGLETRAPQREQALAAAAQLLRAPERAALLAPLRAS
jgi:5-methylthioribose kinase